VFLDSNYFSTRPQARNIESNATSVDFHLAAERLKQRQGLNIILGGREKGGFLISYPTAK
jgi:hypothetical protein